jgi:A/G-specific adenine glycosylase
MQKSTLKEFIQKIESFYTLNKRAFSWRYVEDPYLVAVSEIMLQQTQTYRVEPKYKAFINHFPHFEALANAAHHDLLLHWQGLGYNRRALYLQQLAQWVSNHYGGQLPKDSVLLQTQKGIGYATANSICAFAFNMPTIFIETNIRAVFLHEFFNGKTDIHDKQIMPLVATTVNQTDPRSWYYALMDYGVFLKATVTNPSTRSIHHQKQSRFEGSIRQIRGNIITLLLAHKILSKEALNNLLYKQLKENQIAKIDSTLEKMIVEKLIKKENDHYFL